MNAGPPRKRHDPEDRSVRRTWWLLSGSFLVLAAITLVRAILAGGAVDWAAAFAVAIAAVGAIAHRNAVVDLEVRGRAEAENFARILRGLSRSVSVDAIVGAIVDDLAEGTGADHVVVVRRRPEGGALEATLLTRRAGVPNSSTVLPLGDLELGGPYTSVAPLPVAAPVAVSVAGRVAVPIRPEPGPALTLELAVDRSSGGATSPARASAPILDRPVVAAPPAMPGAAARPAPRPLSATSARGRGSPAARDASVRIRRWLGELVDDFGLSAPPWRRSRPIAPRSEVVGSGAPAQIAGRIDERVRAVYGLSHTLAVALRTEDRVIGAIVVSRRDRDPWDVPARRLLEGAAVEAAAALARAYSYREATANASTDPLTGLPNRRYFDEFCALLARRRRSGDAVAVLMVDIDRFKVLNDAYGHPVGDEVLKAVAGAIVSAVREEDVPARVGGEEFAVLLRNPGPDVALEVGERVREAVRALDLSTVGVPGVSVSVGVANARGADEPIPALVERADKALYRAKRAGRDRVVSA
ncbi:MAG: GGDEF domain-containing protein [Chloroflexi bacterium]|nr:GGDEF domain-containing protein [Chloroflexota bacterium]